MSKHPLYRLLSTFIVLVLLVQMVPVQIFAAEDDTAPAVTVEAVPMNSAEKEPISKDARVLEEITDKRTEYTKQFRLSNGLNMAVVYPDAVHYDDNGQWREIDNTLTLSDSAYVNTAGEWEITLPQQFGNDNAVSITKDGHTLRFHMAGELRSSDKDTLSAQKQELTVEEATPSTAKKKNIAPSEALGAAGYPETVPGKLRSRLEYEDIYPDTDIIYDLNANQLKESIVIGSYSQSLQGYRYILDTGDMTAVLAGDNSIALLAPKTNEVVMVMPAPFLLDDAGVYCSDVTVELAGKDGKYVLTYLLPAEWMAAEERQWPVVLDPVVATVSTISNIKDITVYSHAWSSYEGGVLECGWQASHGIARAFMQYQDLPDLTSSDVVQSAELRLCLAEANSSSNLIEIHKVNETWSSTSVTWNTQPSFDTTIEDFAHAKVVNTEDLTLVPSGANYYCWDITDIVQGWYEDGNTGLAITAPQSVEAGGTNSVTRFWSSDYDIYQYQEKPTVTIYFRNNNGLESYWDYTSSTAGRAGTGYVNNYTGNLVWTRGDMGFGGTQMPVSISHVYNLNDVITPNDNNNSNDSAGNTFGIGLGWRTSYNQLLYHWEIDGATEGDLVADYYVWEDADGTDHYFGPAGSGTYKDEDNLGLTLTVNGTGNEKYRISSKDESSMYFDTLGRLTKISNYQESSKNITITYTTDTGKLIHTITDGANRQYEYIYGTDGLLDRISYYGVVGSNADDEGENQESNTTETEIMFVAFDYEGTLLTKITDKDGKFCTYEYDENNLLEVVTNVDGYKLTYDYNEVTADKLWQPYRVTSVVESYTGKNGVKTGGGIDFEYGHNQTKLTDHDGNVNIKQFNNYGNVICVLDDEGKAMFAEYALNSNDEAANTTDATAKANQLRVSSNLQYTVTNLIEDSNMNGEEILWNGYGDVLFVELDYTHGFVDSTSLLVGPYEPDSGMATEGYTLAPGQSQTFSCYVTSDTTSVYVMAKSGENEVIGRYAPRDNEWHRLQVTYKNEGAENCTVYYCVLAVDPSTFYMDCAQLEYSPTSSRYNLIDNGDFRHEIIENQWTSAGFASGDGVTDISTANVPLSNVPQMDNNVVKIQGNPKGTKRMTQTVYIEGNADDYFTVAGWAMGNAAPSTKYEYNPRKFAIEAVVVYDDETRSDPFTAKFNPDSDEWQFTATGIYAEKAFSAIEVSMVYDYNVNTVYFDGIQLFREGFGSRVEYDEDGNATSVEDSEGKETTYEYDDNNNVTKMTLPTGEVYNYTYDPYHNVTSGGQEDGLTYEYVYDAYGNNTETTVTDGSQSVMSSAAYTEDGNRMVSSTDAMGNTTYYDYDVNTNVLNWVQYPEDTAATKTEYAYDGMLRPECVETVTNKNKEMSMGYTYDNDLLKTVTTPSTTYNFTHGDFSLTTSVVIGNLDSEGLEVENLEEEGTETGNRTLVTYTYSNDRNNRLEVLAYGNGDKVEYKYDDKGRVEYLEYEDGKRVYYTYDNSGRIATITDEASGTVSSRGYDFVDRPSVYTEKNADSQLSLNYSYDEETKKVKTIREVINGIIQTITYDYDAKERLQSYQKGDSKRVYTYDDFERVPSYVTSHKNAEGRFVTVLTTAFTFASSAVSDTSTRVASMSQVTDNYTGTYSYTYDKNGNILSVSDGTHTTTYEYDSQGQLLRENNHAGNFTYMWEYDNAGNILSRKEYAYTTGTISDDTAYVDIVEYNYGGENEVWGDLLTSYDGESITYDKIGNPDSIGGWNFTWQHGRQLARMVKTDNSEEWNFIYNADGLRTRRYNDGDAYEYVYYGGLLQCMEYNDDPVYFTHAPDGTPMAMIYCDETYFYITNLQGDVVGIVDANGNLLVSYTYDAWGNPLSTVVATENNYATYIASINPFRYRGYVYDSETGLYYLQSRYYNPEIGRFINADGYTSTGQGLVGNNMFAYCNNSPISFEDTSGTSLRPNTVYINDGGSGVSSLDYRTIRELIDKIPNAANLPEVQDLSSLHSTDKYQITVDVDDISLALMGKDGSSFGTDASITVGSYVVGEYVPFVSNVLLPFVGYYMRHFYYYEMPELENGVYDVYRIDKVASETIYYNGGTGYMEMLRSHVVLSVYNLVDTSGKVLTYSTYYYSYYSEIEKIEAGRWDGY